MDTRIGFGRRLGAYLLDVLFVIGLGYILVNITGDYLENFVDFSKFNDQQLEAVSASSTMWTFSVLLPIAAALMGFLYNLIEGFTGYTIGKLILKIQIGNQDGTKASQGKLMTRFAIKNIGSIISLFGIATMISFIGTLGSIFGLIIIIGCFFVLGESKLALHDIIAKTAVYPKAELIKTEE
ncbi:MAG: RDD family protein [Salinivirgaceae bacterium]|nr:RDD family protein [Salinivirgaceae bacterium]